MLPLSRNRTYSDADPIVPGDVNDIQDSIIGAKHGLLEAGLDLVPAFPVGATATFDFYKWNFNGGDTVRRGLNLTVGTKVHSIKFGYNRGSHIATLELNRHVRNAPVIIGTTDTVATHTENATGADTVYELVCDHVVETGYTYFIDAGAVGGAGGTWFSLAIFPSRP